MVAPAVGEAVDQPRVAVVGEDHRPVGGEQRVELRVGQAVGMLGVGLQAHQVHDVDDAHPQLGQVLAQQRDRGEGLERRDVAGAGHHHVGIAALSLLAQSQIPSPRVQCATASSIVR